MTGVRRGTSRHDRAGRIISRKGQPAIETSTLQVRVGPPVDGSEVARIAVEIPLSADGARGIVEFSRPIVIIRQVGLPPWRAALRDDYGIDGPAFHHLSKTFSAGHGVGQ